MWAFSLYLEAVAILPQLVLLQRTRNIDNLTGQYVFLLGYVISCLNHSTINVCQSIHLYVIKKSDHEPIHLLFSLGAN